MKLGLIRFSVLFVLGLSSNGYAQTAAIDQVRTQLMAPGGVTVQASGFWATTIPVTEKPSELRVTDGKLSRSSGVRVVHGNVNVLIPPGQVLRVVDVASSNDDRSDLLRVSVQAAGLIVPVAFVFPRGTLQTMTAGDIFSQVGKVLQPRQTQTTAPPARQVMVSAPPPPPPSPPLPFVKWSEPIAGMHTKDVKAACESKENGAQAICYAVFSTLQDADDMAHDAQSSLFGACLPEGTTAQTVRDAFLAETQILPDQLEGPISIFYARTLSDKFPCPKAPAPKRPAAKKKPS